MNYIERLLPDEATTVDHLGYDVYASGLADLIKGCETPLTVGVHGKWGTGKTSLMRMIKAELQSDAMDCKMVRCVWFNPWQFQFEESAVIPLLHAIREEATAGGWAPAAKLKAAKIFNILGSLAGEAVLRATTGGAVSMESILQQGLAFEEKYFETRTVAQRLRDNFADAVLTLVDKEPHSRLVIFVDDLDRCLPEFVLKTLESIKLFLNVPRCVFVVALDPDVVRRAIEERYGNDPKSEAKEYLDKIVQLPFFIPPMPSERIEGFVRSLSADTNVVQYLQIVVEGVERNPRYVKRFLNSLLLHDLLAQRIGIPNYDKRILAKLLVVQFRWPLLFQNFRVLLDFESAVVEGDEKSKNELFERERSILTQVEIGKLAEFTAQKPFLGTVENIEDYVSMSQLGSPIEAHERRAEETVAAADLIDLKLVRQDFRGVNLMDEILTGVDLTGSDFQGANLVGANLSGATLVGCDFTGANLERAVLDDADVSRAKFEKVNFWCASLSGMRNISEAVSWLHANLFGVVGLSADDRTAMSRFDLLDLENYKVYLDYYRDDLGMNDAEIKSVFQWTEHEYFKYMLSPRAESKEDIRK